MLDAAGRNGREVSWTAAEFGGFRHGYAGTIYKGQGKTLDRTYLYHTEHWRSAASYVALTRQRESAEVFVARETARDAGQLARQMARGEVRSASIAWATRSELGAEQNRAAEKAREAERAPAPLLPAWRDPTGQGRDSVGRGLDERSVLEAVLADGAVKREREALGHYMQGAYRDPDAAHAAIGEMVKRDGWYRAGQEIARDPAQFGELRGKTGWLASAASKEERAGAERTAHAVPDSLRRIHEASEAARRAYVQEVQTQQNRDATEIPGLSKGALTVLRDTREARLMGEIQREGESYDARMRRREEMVAAAWEKGRANPSVAGELDRFVIAASQRLGPEGEQAALRAEASGRTMELPGIGREQRAGLDELARHFAETREAVTLSARWEHRVEREAKEAERWQARQQERERRGLTREPEQDRERQHRERGRDLGR